jgi:hypothetical protein
MIILGVISALVLICLGTLETSVYWAVFMNIVVPMGILILCIMQFIRKRSSMFLFYGISMFLVIGVFLIPFFMVLIFGAMPTPT